ncbi:unnamed protein product (mitochondrion) [Parajaminaea phylloscopi]|uniref:Uncharacterized protein n=1 Tax=Parajaminaea phylloscopi TaxID=1463510 RepID=A0AB39A6X4_9BASI
MSTTATDNTKTNTKIMLLCFIIVCITLFVIEIFSTYVYINTINSIPIPVQWGELVETGLIEYGKIVVRQEQMEEARQIRSVQKISNFPGLKDYLDNERHKGTFDLMVSAS